MSRTVGYTFDSTPTSLPHEGTVQVPKETTTFGVEYNEEDNNVVFMTWFGFGHPPMCYRKVFYTEDVNSVPSFSHLDRRKMKLRGKNIFVFLSKN